MTRAAVIIVIHNSSDCLEAYLRSPLIEKTWRILRVNNASTDDTVKKARRVDPDLSMLLNRQSIGLAAAVNRGCKIAGGGVFLILSPDVVARRHSVDKLARTVSTQGVGAAGGLLPESNGQAQVGFTFRRLPALASALVEVLLLNRLWANNPINRHTGGHSVGKLNFRECQSFWYRNLLRYFAKHQSCSELCILRVRVGAGLFLRSLLSWLGFRPAAVSIPASVSTFLYVMWHYAVRGRDLRPNELPRAIASPAG